MTPHDELMALAGKAAPGEWRQEHRPTAKGGYETEVFDADGQAIATLAWHAMPPRYEGGMKIVSTDREANAAFIAAACNFVRSDAFRAMARDAERYRWLREYDVDSYLACGRGEKLDAAIDAAASGAGEGSP